MRRSVDPAICRQRNLIERVFRKLKQFRRVPIRFDKLARNFLTAALLASIRFGSELMCPLPDLKYWPSFTSSLAETSLFRCPNRR